MKTPKISKYGSLWPWNFHDVLKNSSTCIWPVLWLHQVFMMLTLGNECVLQGQRYIPQEWYRNPKKLVFGRPSFPPRVSAYLPWDRLLADALKFCTFGHLMYAICWMLQLSTFFIDWFSSQSCTGISHFSSHSYWPEELEKTNWNTKLSLSVSPYNCELRMQKHVT